VEIFQLYLDQYEPNENRQAAEVIAEFMGWESLKEGVLNRKGTQRVIMVAANFRKEVTNTALWLMQFGIRAQCFKVTPTVSVKTCLSISARLSQPRKRSRT
jgi:hypothetical protein